MPPKQETRPKDTSIKQVSDFYWLPLGKRWKPASERLAHYSYTFSSGDQFVLIFASQLLQPWHGPKAKLGLDILILYGFPKHFP